jgi:hypothetical protein
VSLLIGLPEQNLSCAVIGLCIMTGFTTWYRVRDTDVRRIAA